MEWRDGVSVVRTWAPRGETPILRGRLTRDHLSAINGITPERELYLQVQQEAYNAFGVLVFFEHLLAQIPGPILVLWDPPGSSLFEGRRRFPAEVLQRCGGRARQARPEETAAWPVQGAAGGGGGSATGAVSASSLTSRQGSNR